MHALNLPALGPRAGIGLRAEHALEFIERRPGVGFVEVHAENAFGRGGRPLEILERVRREHALSLHGVGLSIGSTDPLSAAHLDRLAALIERFEPALVSDHLCWASHGGVYANDLLPLPLTGETVRHVTRRVMQVQERLKRPILLENVSSYLQYVHSTLPEWEVLAEVARRSGCGILLDVNNVHVSAHNHGFDALDYLRGIPIASVGEIHLAGHVRNDVEGGAILIDTHSRPVSDAVWGLYRIALDRFGPVPTLIEWDADLPALDVLLGEARTADRWLAQALTPGTSPPSPTPRTEIEHALVG
jgi:uncharacterized protein (UPF0276 family)